MYLAVICNSEFGVSRKGVSKNGTNCRLTEIKAAKLLMSLCTQDQLHQYTAQELSLYSDLESTKDDELVTVH